MVNCTIEHVPKLITSRITHESLVIYHTYQRLNHKHLMWSYAPQLFNSYHDDSFKRGAIRELLKGHPS